MNRETEFKKRKLIIMECADFFFLKCIFNMFSMWSNGFLFLVEIGADCRFYCVKKKEFKMLMRYSWNIFVAVERKFGLTRLK